jgi:hypothetical protein
MKTYGGVEYKGKDWTEPSYKWQAFSKTATDLQVPYHREFLEERLCIKQ